MASQEPNIGLNYGWGLGESGWDQQMDENLRAIGALLHLEVLSRDVDDPSTLSPEDGDRYLIPSGATGVWDGQDGKIARYMDGEWELHTPKAGWRCVIVDENVLVRYDGDEWIGLPTEVTLNDGSLGIDKLEDFAQRSSTTSGLTFGYRGGRLRNDNTVYVVSNGTVDLAADSTNYVEVDDSGSVSVNSSGFSSGRVPLYEVETDADSITGVDDQRAWVNAGTGGGVSNFYALSDTPDNYTDEAGNALRVNTAEDALEFFAAAAEAHTHEVGDIEDTGGSEGQVPTIDSEGNVVWATPPGGEGGESNDGTNVGSGAGVYKDKSGSTLRFRSLIGGDGVDITEGSDEITIDADTETTHTASSASFDRADGGIQEYTLTADETVSVTIDDGQSMTIHLTDGDAHTVTWPTMTWVGGSAPTLTSADVIEFWKVGSTLYGAYVGSIA